MTVLLRYIQTETPQYRATNARTNGLEGVDRSDPLQFVFMVLHRIKFEFCIHTMEELKRNKDSNTSIGEESLTDD